MKVSEIVVHFGKHKGKTLAQIRRDDIDYLDWLSGSDFADLATSVREYLTSIPKHEFIAAKPIGFGKHRDHTWKYVALHDPDYLTWLVETAVNQPEGAKAQAMLDWLRTAPHRVTMPFGKHKGRSLGWIATKEPGYLEYMAEHMEMDGLVRQFIREMVQNGQGPLCSVAVQESGVGQADPGSTGESGPPRNQPVAGPGHRRQRRDRPDGRA